MICKRFETSLVYLYCSNFSILKTIFQDKQILPCNLKELVLHVLPVKSQYTLPNNNSPNEEKNSCSRRKLSQRKKILGTEKKSHNRRKFSGPQKLGGGSGWGAATLHPPTPLPDINAKIYLLPIDNYTIIVKGKKVKNNAKYFKFLENYW